VTRSKRGWSVFWKVGAGIVTATALLSACCNGKPAQVPPAGQVCALGSPAPPKLPRLFRARTSAPPNSRYASAPICTLPHKLSDECEIVDDVDALLGTGFDCVNGKDAPLAACADWRDASRLTPSTAPPTCGESACADLSLVIRDPTGASQLITFYDDPSCHRPPKDPNCPRTGRACYYRVHGVGPAPAQTAAPQM